MAEYFIIRDQGRYICRANDNGHWYWWPSMDSLEAHRFESLPRATEWLDQFGEIYPAARVVKLVVSVEEIK